MIQQNGAGNHAAAKLLAFEYPASIATWLSIIRFASMMESRSLLEIAT